MYRIPIITNQENLQKIIDKNYMRELEFQIYPVVEGHLPKEDPDGPVVIWFEEKEILKECQVMEREIFWYRKLQKDTFVILVLQQDTIPELRKALELHADEVIIRSDYFQEEEFQMKCQETLQSVAHQLVLCKKTILERKRLEEYEFRDQQKFMEKLLINMLERSEEVEPLLPDYNEKYHTRFGTGIYQVMVIGLEQYAPDEKDHAYVKAATMVVMHVLRSPRQIVFGSYKWYGLVAILHYPEFVSREQKEREWLLLKKELRKLNLQYGEHSLLMGVGQPKQILTEIWDSFLEGVTVTEYQRDLERDVYMAEELEIFKPRKFIYQFVPKQKIKELSRHVALGDCKRVNEWFDDFYSYMEIGFEKYAPAYALFVRVVYEYVMEWAENMGFVLFQERKFVAIQHILDGTKRIQALQKTLIEICHVMGAEVNEKSGIALRAVNYMREHYNEQITLEILAEKCSVSPYYFSRKFKEQTGDNYKNTLANIRIVEAQKLLNTTDMTISDIVEKVGYCDEKHFRKLFVKFVGVTPSVYRENKRYGYVKREKLIDLG